MALETLVSEERLEKIKGHAFCINPDADYDREEFVKRADNLFDVEDYSMRLSKNTGDSDAMKDLIGLATKFMVGDSSQNANLLWENPNLALEQAELLYSYGSSAMAKYVERNRDKFLKELSAEQLYSLFLRVSTYKSDKLDKEYERVRSLKEKVSEMRQAAERGGDIGRVVDKEVEELIKSAPEEQQAFIARNQHAVVPYLRDSIAGAIQREFASLFRNEKGELQGDKLRKFLEDNYRVVEDFIEDEISADSKEGKRERESYWENNLKYQYLEIARELFQSEKKAEKLESANKETREKEERKSKAKKLGIRT